MKMKKMIFLVLTLLTLSAASMNAQVTIGADTDPHAGAVLDLKSTTQGLKLPAVSLSDVNTFQLDGDPTQAIGMTVYNTNYNVTGWKGVGLYTWTGSVWTTAQPDPAEYCPSSVTDIDGNTYAAKLFGSQCWMTQDLRVTRTPDGVALDSVYLNGGFYNTENAAVKVEWDGTQVIYTPDINSGIGATYTRDGVLKENVPWADFANTFGLKYTYTQAQKACPSGWHLPTNNELWALGEWSNKFWKPGYKHGNAGKLKADNAVYMGRDTDNERKWGGAADASARSGFNALPSGYVKKDKTAFGFTYSWQVWLSPSAKGDMFAAIFQVYNALYAYYNDEDSLLGVRCVKLE
ncbi:hypothetical protein FACS189421_07390 [Bacteroidia bacterium]|nr:hypothetical protein FACS189421_07390 [Bacteroidia bacterium]GHT02777.1 hypothetical protein FACS189423_02190 [Bacteroidia bacterium]GHT45676.1 hypothetical protein FACS189440_02120 [Bacteroidia bacterium]